MKAFLLIEKKRVMRNVSLWIALFLSMLLNLIQYINVAVRNVQYLNICDDLDKKVGVIMPQSVFNNWMGGEFYTFWHYAFFMILPILAVLPFGASSYVDRKEGIIKNYFIREEKIKYYSAKYLVGFLSGGIVVAIPLIVNLLLTAATLPSITPQPSAGTFSLDGSAIWAELFYSSPYLYCARYILLIFIFSGLFACVALSFGLFMDNIFSVLILPFIIYMFLYVSLNGDRLNRFVPIEFLDPNQGNGFNSIEVIAFEMIVLIAIALIAIMIGVKRETM